MHNGGDDVHNYDDLLNGVAEAGYFVVAARAGYDDYCFEEYEDQLRNIEWALTDKKYSQYVYVDNPAGLLGHSMGGAATHTCAADKDAVNRYRLGAAVALHPVYNKADAVIPIFFGSGSKDFAVPAATV